jgi:molybdenum cofactor cytidylyltransferase
MTDVAAVVLAAGRGSRFSQIEPGALKMLAMLDGKPLLRHVVEAALASRARPEIVVSGHERAAVERSIAETGVRIVHNLAYASGLASSLKAGLAALPPEVAGAVVLLGDMPRVSSGLIDALVVAFSRAPGSDAVVPLYAGQRGNPVLLSRALFADVARLEGDEGARRLLSASRHVLEIAIDDPAIALDIDTPDALEQARRERR